MSAIDFRGVGRRTTHAMGKLWFFAMLIAATSFVCAVLLH